MNLKRLIVHTLFLAFPVLLIATPLYAQDLKAAKAQGLVGETSTGYLEPVSPAAAASMQQLIDKVNGERRQRYQEIAAKNGTPVAAVEALAANKALEMTPPGEFIKGADGSWQKKK